MKSAGGFHIGMFEGRELIDRSHDHVAIIGATGAGKDQSLIIKTMLDGWYGSTVSHDLKGELWATCARRRSRFAHQLRFDLTDPFSVGINPLDWIEPEHRSGMSDLSPAVSQMQNIVGFITEDGDKTHWTTAARGYMVGVGLHLLYAGRDEDKNIGGMRRFIARGDAGLFEMQGVAAHPICSRVASEMLAMGGKGKESDEKEQSAYRGSVYNSAGALLNLWDDPVIDRVTSRSDFDVADLMCAESPCDLYLVNRPSDSERIRPVNKCVLVMIRRMLMHEELTAKGRVKNYRVGGIYNEVLELKSGDEPSVARAARSYGFKFLFAGQSLIEIEKEMGNGLLNNCATRVFFRPNDDREARRISEMIGDARVQILHESRSYNQGGMFAKGYTVSPREEPRPVLPADEIMRWPQRTHAVILGGGKPILSDVRMAYQQPHYANLMAPAPELRNESGDYSDLPGGDRKFVSPWLGRRKKGPPRAVVNTAGGKAAKGTRRDKPVAAAVPPDSAAAPARRVAI